MNHRRILSQITLVIGVLLFSAGLQTFAAFTAPTVAPPGADAYAPLHTSSDAQSKVGGLLLNTGGATNGLLVQFGNVGIGTISPAAKLDVTGEVKFGNTSATCDAAHEGQQRYNSTSKGMEFCNGTVWGSMGGGAGGGALATGFVGCYAGATVPSNTLEAYGQAVSRTTYASLFSIIGTTYGAGDGSTTFNLPDLRGRVMLGMDNLGGTAAGRITSASVGGANSTTLGGTGGAETHSLTPGQAPALSGGAAGLSGWESAVGVASGYSGANGAAHNNTQPWIAFRCVIGV